MDPELNVKNKTEKPGRKKKGVFAVKSILNTFVFLL